MEWRRRFHRPQSLLGRRGHRSECEMAESLLRRRRHLHRPQWRWWVNAVVVGRRRDHSRSGLPVPALFSPEGGHSVKNRDRPFDSVAGVIILALCADAVHHVLREEAHLLVTRPLVVLNLIVFSVICYGHGLFSGHCLEHVRKVSVGDLISQLREEQALRW